MKNNNFAGACLLLCSSAFIGGCATIGPELTQISSNASSNDIKPVTFDYPVPNVSKDILYKRGRDYLAATAYADSRSVISEEDANDGLIIGKGSIAWILHTGMATPTCYSEYHIRFMAKDAKARLQLELIEGTPTYSRCTAWTLPTITSYQDILASFNNTGKGLENALNGLGSGNSFKDF